MSSNHESNHVLLRSFVSTSNPLIHQPPSSSPPTIQSALASTSVILKPPPPSPQTPPLTGSSFPQLYNSTINSLPSLANEDLVADCLTTDESEEDDEETADHFDCLVAPPPYQFDDLAQQLNSLHLPQRFDSFNSDYESKSNSAMQLSIGSARYHTGSQLEHVSLGPSPGSSPSSYHPSLYSSSSRYVPVRRQSSPLINAATLVRSTPPAVERNSLSFPTPASPPPLPVVIVPNGGAKEKRIGHRRVNDDGQVTYKRIKSTQIMHSIQLGIGYSVGSLASKPERDLLVKDFEEIETVQFPKSGSTTTPAHHYADFVFSTYAPFAFRYFRDLFRIQPDDFMLSVVNEPLKELSNPGASGSVFYRTRDDQFIIKTVERNEAKFLRKLMPGYFMNLSQNPHTMLPKFFGLYCYECTGKNIRILVMNNILPSCIKIQHKYDLKGSTFRRRASQAELKKPLPTYKDLDFIDHYYNVSIMEMIQQASLNDLRPVDYPNADNGNFPSNGAILLESRIYDELIDTLHRDCRVLQSFEIMDYSLLMGVHNYDHSLQDGTRKKKFIQFDYDDDEQLPTGAIRAINRKGERLLLFIGIIDILQSYRLVKKVEHTWKSLVYDGNAISVHRPDFYSNRFLDFLTKQVFGKISSTNQPNESYYYRYSKARKSLSNRMNSLHNR